MKKFVILVFCIVSVALATSAQTKKNTRPAEAVKPNITKELPDSKIKFTYEFTNPRFLVSKVVINHDENGFGTVTWEKTNVEKPITVNVELSKKTMSDLRELWGKLNFLDSDTHYQSPVRDYGHLGTIRVTMDDDGKRRTETFNWTEDLDARALGEEYKAIGNQYMWVFDFNLARSMQPLEAPNLMKALDSQLRRKQIADPFALVDYLNKVQEDESVPLIARNHAGRILKVIESNKKKAEEEATKAKSGVD